MPGRVAVEPNLAPVRAALEREGFEVVPLEPGATPEVDAIVVTGMSENLAGHGDARGRRAPVIDARGLSAEQVVAEVRRRQPGR